VRKQETLFVGENLPSPLYILGSLFSTTNNVLFGADKQCPFWHGQTMSLLARKKTMSLLAATNNVLFGPKKSLFVDENIPNSLYLLGSLYFRQQTIFFMALQATFLAESWYTYAMVMSISHIYIIHVGLRMVMNL